MPRLPTERPAPVIGEAELAAASATLFARADLWHDLRLPATARDNAGAAPWSAYWALRLGPLADPAADRAVLEGVHAAFLERGDRLGALLASAAAIESYYHDETALEPLDGWIARLEAQLAAGQAPWPNPECGAEVMACGSGILLRQPRHPLLADWAEQGRRAVLHMAHGPSRIKLAAFIVQYHLWRGESGASALVADALPGVDLSQLRAPEALLWLQGLSAHARFAADFQRGRAAVRHALALIERHGLTSRAYAAHAHGAALALAAEDLDAASVHLDAMRATLSERALDDQTHYWHMSVGQALLRGDAPAAVALARSTLEQSIEVGGPYRAAAHRLSLASALHVAGDFAASAREAQAAAEAARAIDANLIVFSAGLVASSAFDRLGHRHEADALLAASLAVGAVHDYATTTAWWMPALVSDRLARALALGIEPAYASRLALRAGLRCPDPTLESWPWALRLRALGDFAVTVRDASPQPALPRRSLDLLRALLAHGGVSLPVATALDWLWPDAEYEQQRKAFDAALLRLRRALGDETLLRLDGSHLQLDSQRCWSDVQALAASDWNPAQAAGDRDALVALAERLLRLVRGPLLAGTDAPWVLAARARMRQRFVLALAPIAQALETGAPHEACRLYEQALAADPLAESLTRRLIAAQLARGERAEALRAWHHCKALLALHGMAPAAETVALVRQSGLVR
jgi:LuxR family transcriptional regulator, maltose regulon positive regulatory protein